MKLYSRNVFAEDMEVPGYTAIVVVLLLKLRRYECTAPGRLPCVSYVLRASFIWFVGVPWQQLYTPAPAPSYITRDKNTEHSTYTNHLYIDMSVPCAQFAFICCLLKEMLFYYTCIVLQCCVRKFLTHPMDIVLLVQV